MWQIAWFNKSLYVRLTCMLTRLLSPLNAVHDIEDIQGKGKEKWNVIVRIGIIRALNESAAKVCGHHKAQTKQL